MSADPLMSLYEESRKKSVECFNAWWSHNASTLDDDQNKRLLTWLRQFRRTPRSAAARNSMARFLGGGVWRCDYTREQIYYDHLWTQFGPLQDDIRRVKQLMRVPFERGTIGYVVGKASFFPAEYYLVDDTERDLRGSFALEDRLIGEICAITYPIGVVKEDKEASDVQAVLCLFHPVPRLFTPAFAELFVERMRDIGHQLLRLWDRERYRRLTKSIERSFRRSESASVADSADLAQRVEQLAKGISWMENESNASVDASFAWVGMLDCGPGAPVFSPSFSGKGIAIESVPLSKSWTEPEAFMRAKQLNAMDLCGHRRGFGASGLEYKSPAIHFDKCPWSDQVKDLVVPFPDDSDVRSASGMLRIHYSSLKDELPPFDEAAVPAISGVRSEIGNLLKNVRILFRDQRDPIKLKVEREWERLLFEQILMCIFSDKEGDEARFRRLVAESWDRLWENEEPKRKLKVVTTSFWELIKTLRHLPEMKYVIGADYWAWDEQMVLTERRPMMEDPHLQRDLQLALTLLTATRDVNAGEWIGHWSGHGRLMLPGGKSCYLHFPQHDTKNAEPHYHALAVVPQAQDCRFAVCLKSRDGRVLRKATWVRKVKWPMVRAWHACRTSSATDQGPLALHLARCRTHMDLGEIHCQLTRAWHPKDGTTEDLVAPTDIRMDRNAKRRVGEILTGSGDLVIWPDQWLGKHVPSHERALWTYVAALAGEEILDLARLWAIPVQVLNHVYFWLVLGVRSELAAQAGGAIDSVLTALAVAVRGLAAEEQMKTLRDISLNDLVRRDYIHHFQDSIDEIKPLVAALEGNDKVTPSQVQGARQGLDAITRWLYAHTQGIDERFENGMPWEQISVHNLLTTATEIAETRHPRDRSRIKQWCDGLLTQADSNTLLDVNFRMDLTKEQYMLLVIIWTDILLNAGKNSNYCDSAKLGWLADRGIALLENPIRVTTPLSQETLNNVFMDLNSCLALPPKVPSWLELREGLGLRNVFSAANRLRIGLEYDIVGSGTARKCRVSLFLKRFVRMP